jgi:hypothetical protein
MLSFKSTVRIVHFTEQLALVLRYAANWAAITKVGVEVNAIDDSEHTASTLHGWSLAIDLDTAGDVIADLERLHGYLARHLPVPFEVLLETDHIHVEWDVHRKKSTLPAPRA